MFELDNNYIRDYMRGNGVLLEISEEIIYFGYRDFIMTIYHNFMWDYFFNHAQVLPLRDHVNALSSSTPMELAENFIFYAPEWGVSKKSNYNAFDILNVFLGRLDKHQKSRLPQWFVEGVILKKLEE